VKQLSENSWLGDRFHALRRHDAGNTDGFVCVLDLRDFRKGHRTVSLGQLLAVTALIACVVFVANRWIESLSDPALPNDRDAGRIIEPESPPDFSPGTAPPQTPSN
jgi:hypothetical protein